MNSLTTKARFIMAFTEMKKLLPLDLPVEEVWFCAYEMITQVDALKLRYNENLRLKLMN